ncbi:MAG TPA: SMC-Scp complex subunit ScpB [Lachnospiraceae bacterium]|nr:SMC-Scp complex subunit ScpB [Lachnospiraceae bacterium]HPF29929.1 SMC-Scp complex subunit ScpB [Lachnospiraceae bacterium]
MEREKTEAIIEAILFALGASVTIDKLAEVLELDKKEVKELLADMKSRYEKDDRGIELVELENSVQLGTKSEAYEYLQKIVKNSQRYALTDTVLETLSIVAYKQPVTRGEIERIRGVSCDHAINKLLEYDLIEEVGRLDAPGRPLLFGTTEQFLRSFGVRSIGDLPSMSPELIEDFKEQAEEEANLKVDV